MRTRKLVIGVAAVLSLVGCTSGSDEAPKADPTKVVRTIDPAKATTLKLGDDLEVLAELPRKMGDQDVYFHGFTADGKVLGSAALPEGPSDGQMGSVTSQAHPVMYDPETKKFTVLDSRKREKNTQLPSIISSGDFVVWLETPETNIGVSTIAIYSYDRRSKKVTQLYSASDPDGRLVWGSDLVVSEGTVYFSMSSWKPKDNARSRVYAVPVDGSRPARVLVKGGAFVTLAGDSLTYAVKDARFSRDLRTGETSPVPVSPRANDPGFCGAELVEGFETLCMGTPAGDEPSDVTAAVLTVTERSGRKTVFEPFPSDSLNHPVPHDVVPMGPWVGVTMTDDDGADRKFLVDLESRAVKAFPKNTAFRALNDDRTQALMSIVVDGKTWPQVIVRIPPGA
jgi:hypothetical protein